MKIAILTENYIPLVGGAEIFVIKLAKYLVNKGHEVDIITLKHDDDHLEFEVIDEVNVYRVNYLKNIKGLSLINSSYKLYRALIRNNKENQYDIVHSIAEVPTSQAGTLFKIFKNKPHLITIQGGYIAGRECLKEHDKRTSGDKILEKIISWAFKRCDALHAISGVIARESGELGAKNIKIIPNGVDKDMIREGLKEKNRKELGIPLDRKVIISLSRLTPRKGFKYVIRAFAKIVKKYPDASLIIVGDGKQREYLENLSRELGIEKNVDFKGTIPHDEIVKILPAADAFALSPIFEGLGIVYIESLACEVPVVTTEVGGIPDIIENEINGLFIPYGDVDAFYRALDRILTDEKLHNDLKKNGLQIVKDKFIWENIFSEIEGLYDEIKG